MVIFSTQSYDFLQHYQGDINYLLREEFTQNNPHRLNPIGMSISDLLIVQTNFLQGQDLGALNCTSLLDLKLC